MSDSDEIILNAPAVEDAEGDLANRHGLQRMKESFAEIASSPRMFGDIPNAEAASAALESAVQAMLSELERAGVSVEDMVTSAQHAAEVAQDTDSEANQQLNRAQRGSLSVDDRGAIAFSREMDPGGPTGGYELF